MLLTARSGLVEALYQYLDCDCKSLDRGCLINLVQFVGFIHAMHPAQRHFRNCFQTFVSAALAGFLCASQMPLTPSLARNRRLSAHMG
jgi:hypothetical protein